MPEVGQSGSLAVDNPVGQSTIQAVPQAPQSITCPPGLQLVGTQCLPIPSSAGEAPKLAALGYVAPSQPSQPGPPVGPGVPQAGLAPPPAGASTTDSGLHIIPPPFPWWALILGLGAVTLFVRK